MTAGSDSRLEHLRMLGRLERKRIEESCSHWTSAMIWELIAVVLNILLSLAWIFARPGELNELRTHVAFTRGVEAQVAGDHVHARHLYRFAAEHSGDAADAEQAAYKAGWVALYRLGDFDAARRSFRSYGERYPDGAFRVEVGEHLAFLGEITPGAEEMGRVFLCAEILESRGDFARALALLDRLQVAAGGDDRLNLRIATMRARLTSQREERVEYRRAAGIAGEFL